MRSFDLTSLNDTNATYIQFLSITANGLSTDHYAIKYLSIETTLTSRTSIKSKKYNYISTIEPKIIENISGTLTNLNNTTIVGDNTGRVVFNFLIKPSL